MSRRAARNSTQISAPTAQTSVKDDPFRTIILDFGVAQLGQEAGVITRTGARDFLTGPEIFHRMMTHPVVDPRQYNPVITEGFARATLMALALDPARRPDSARALAVMLAEATPANNHAPSGIEILNRYADELLEGGASRQPTPPSALAGSGRQRRIAAQIAAPSAPMSTLGATASQAFPAVQDPGASRRRRRSVLAIAICALAAAVTGAVLFSRHEAPGSPGTAKPHDQAVALQNDATIVNSPAHDAGGTVAVTRSEAATSDAAREITNTRLAPGRLPPEGEAAVAHAGTTIAADANVPRAGATVAVDANVPRAEAAGAGNADVPRAGAAVAMDAGTVDAAQLAVYPRDAGMPAAAIKVVRPEPVATGKLNVIILPWAEVWVDGKPLGQTPVTAKLSVGSHRVRLRNDVTEKTVTVTVTNGKTTVIDQTW